MKIIDLKHIQFRQIFNDINNFLAQSMGSVKSINKNTIFGQLMTVMASITHHIMLYIEDALMEQNKYTAQRRKSVLGLAAQSGYIPSYGKATSCRIRFIQKSGNFPSTRVSIANRQSLVCSKNGLYYNIILPGAEKIITLGSYANDSDVIQAVQGQFESQQFTSTGGPLYTQNIKYVGYIDTDYMEVRVNGETYIKRESLYDMGPEERSFYIQYNPVSGVDVVFGNGIHGHALVEGDNIHISYLLHDGESGNLEAGDDVFFLFDEPIHDTLGEEVDGNIYLEVRPYSNESISSGSNPESLDLVKKMIGYNTRSLVLSDPNSYAAMLGRYSFVGYNRTWAEPGSLVVRSLIMRNYKMDMTSGLDYFSLTPDKFSLSDQQKSSIRQALVSSGRMLVGSIYDIVDMELCKYALYVYIRLKSSGSDKSSVSNRIRQLIGEFFSNIQSDSYIPKSDIINLIKGNVSEVDGVTCYFLSERNELAIQTRQYEQVDYIFDPSTGTYKQTKQTVKLKAGENPLLGLDAHGNIWIAADHQFPVLMGGWDFVNTAGQEVTITDPLNIIFEN